MKKGTEKTTIKQKLTREDRILLQALKSDKIHVTNNNSKCGPACLCVNFPCSVCRDDAPCKKDCYCMKGRQQFTNVQGAYLRNLIIYKKSPVDFFNQLDNAITFYALPLFRFFDAGDIVDARFFNMAVELAEKHNNVLFLMYTKKYDIVNNYIHTHGDDVACIPSNLCVRFSYWTKDWNVDNVYNLPGAYVDFNNHDMTPAIPRNAFICKCNGVTCSTCKMCFNKKVNAIRFYQH